MTEVRRIFASVLRCDSIAAEQSFFAAGGDSFGLVEVAALLRESLGVEITVREINAAPSAVLLADVIFQKLNALEPDLAEEVAALEDDEIARSLTPATATAARSDIDPREVATD